MVFGVDGALYIAGSDSWAITRHDPQSGDLIDVFVEKSSGGLMLPTDMVIGAG